MRRQDTLREVSRFSDSWIVSQGAVELARLQATIAQFGLPGSAIDSDQVQLRLDILLGRADLLKQGDSAHLLAGDPELAQAVGVLDAALKTTQELMPRLDDAVARQQMLTALAPLETTLPRLAATVYDHDISAVSDQLNQLDKLYWVFNGLLLVLFGVGFGLIFLILWHNRLLRVANAEVESLVVDLRRTGDELADANTQVVRAMDETHRQMDELRARDAALNLQNVRFNAALNNMSQALCMIDAEQRMIVCNARFMNLFGLVPEQVVQGTPIATVFKAIAETGCYESPLIEATFTQQQTLNRNGVPLNFVEESDRQSLAVSHQPMSGGGWVATYEDVTERRQVEARIRFMAHHDALTGLPNRLLFWERMEAALARHRTVQSGLSGGGLSGGGLQPRDADIGDIAVLCLDLDHFKDVNDTLGHPAGDLLLKEVTNRLRRCVRETDIVARLGGDEFAILQTAVAQPDGAIALARRLVATIQEPFELQGHHARVGLSVGIAVASTPTIDTDTLLRNADMALYQAKSSGRGTWRTFETSMEAVLQKRRLIELRLRDAVLQRNLSVEYQPMIDLRTNRVSGFEALARWNHPDVGVVPPTAFIPVAEEIGLISELGEWMLETACADAARWPAHLKVAVNLSPVQFRNPRLRDTILHALRRAGLDPGRLELEITEGALLTDNSRVTTLLHALREQNIRTVLDDFGTGYSALGYLRSFPFDKIKIDKSFVRDLETRPDCMAIVHSIIELAAKLGMTTTAEGVETEAQAAQLRSAGCTEGQGFHFGYPVPASKIDQWFERSATIAEPIPQG